MYTSYICILYGVDARILNRVELCPHTIIYLASSYCYRCVLILYYIIYRYDARILNLVELEVGLESNHSNHKVRVQYQNCNPGIAEDLPVRHVRRRSEAFRAGQVPQVGKMV